MKNKFVAESARIAAHIHSHPNDLDESYYGKAFTAWLWNIHRYSDWKKPLKEWMSAIPPKEFHWEFQNLALIQLYERTSDAEIKSFLLHETKHRHLQHTNWSLMRAVFYAQFHRLISPRGLWKRRAQSELKRALANQINGFFLDEKNTSASLQYHAYSTLLLDILSREPGFHHLKGDVEKGVQLLNEYLLPSGEINYFGRGQHQLFGAAAAIALFARNGYMESAERVLKNIQSFSTKGIPPLVLTESEKKSTSKSGWYTYNRLYDYVSFAGIMYALAGDAITRAPPLPSSGSPSFPYLQTISRGNQKLVVGKPTTPTIFSESLAWPVVGTPSKSYFLAQGGSYANQAMRYSIGAPYFTTKSETYFAGLELKTIHTRKNGFTLQSKTELFDFNRQINWENNKVKIDDTVSFKKTVKGNLCLVNIPFSDFVSEKKTTPTRSTLAKKGFSIQSPTELVIEEAESASGIGPQLRGYIERVFSANETIESSCIFTIPGKKSSTRLIMKKKE